MRSRADLRVAAEWALRTALVVALAVALARSLSRPPDAPMARRADVRGLANALAEATRSPRVTALAVDVDSVPATAERAWLVALRRAGVDVSWSGRLAALAVAAERSREPDARVRIAVVSDSGAPVALADSAGALDSLATSARGGTLLASTVVGRVRASRGRMVASVALPEATPPRAVLVLGRAGWEGKFVAAALQEAGWTVRARQTVAPRVVVADAGLLPVDTARYAAVVALDSTAADLAPAIARFAVQGGGLVLAGGTTALPAFAALAPAPLAARRPGRVMLDADTLTRDDLPRRPLGALRGDAVRLAGTLAEPTLAVRRALLGRVLTVGYDETWRWRMLGGATGPAAHREWWSRAVGLVAPERGAAAGDAEAAPLAAMVGALGPPTVRPAGRAPATPASRTALLLVAIVAALLAETASRRFRGAS